MITVIWDNVRIHQLKTFVFLSLYIYFWFNAILIHKSILTRKTNWKLLWYKTFNTKNKWLKRILNSSDACRPSSNIWPEGGGMKSCGIVLVELTTENERESSEQLHEEFSQPIQYLCHHNIDLNKMRAILYASSVFYLKYYVIWNKLKRLFTDVSVLKGKWIKLKHTVRWRGYVCFI